MSFSTCNFRELEYYSRPLTGFNQDLVWFCRINLSDSEEYKDKSELSASRPGGMTYFGVLYTFIATLNNNLLNGAVK